MVGFISVRQGLVVLGMTLLAALPGHAQEAVSLDVQWEHQIAGATYGTPTVVAGFLYVGGESGVLYQLDRESGTVNWEYDAGSGIGGGVGADAQGVYFQTRDGGVHALNHDGTEQWRYSTEGEQRWDAWDYSLATPVVDGRSVFVASGDHHIHALSQRTGDLRWKVRMDGPSHSTPALDGDLLVAASYGGDLKGINKATGEVTWTQSATGNLYFPTGAYMKGPRVHENVAYIGSRDYHIYAVSTLTGNVLWTHRTPSWVVATPTVAGASLYVGNSDDPHIVAVDLASGTPRWQAPVDLNVFGEVAIVEDRYVAAADFAGRVYLFDLESGARQAVYENADAAANRERYFDGDTPRTDYNASYESYWAYWEEGLARDLGLIAGGVVAEGETIYLATGSGRVIALRVR